MELRPVINVAILGCVSAGKSTFLNMLMTNMFSDCHRKRTTTMPQIYREITKAEERALKSGEKETYHRELSDLDNIRAANTKVNEEMKEQAKSGASIALSDIKPIEYLVPKIKGFAKLTRDKSGSDTTLSIYDLPGLNDSLSKNAYFEYIKQNFHDYDIIIFVIDINSAMNTSDEIDILNLILTQIQINKWNEERCSEEEEYGGKTELLILINKCDELVIEKEPMPIDNELVEMYQQCKNIIIAKCKEFDIPEPPFVCISCEDAFIYRMIDNTQIDKLDEKYINRIGQLEFTSREWKSLTLAEKKLKLNSNTFNAKDGLTSSGFTHFVTVFNNILSKYNQFEFITKHVDRDIFNYFGHYGGDWDSGSFDILEVLKTYKFLRVKISLIYKLFDIKKRGDGKTMLDDTILYPSVLPHSNLYTSFGYYIEAHEEEILPKIEKTTKINKLVTYVTNLKQYESLLTSNGFIINDIIIAVNKRLKSLCNVIIGDENSSLQQLTDIIKIAEENKIDITDELRNMLKNFASYVPAESATLGFLSPIPLIRYTPKEVVAFIMSINNPELTNNKLELISNLSMISVDRSSIFYNKHSNPSMYADNVPYTNLIRNKALSEMSGGVIYYITIAGNNKYELQYNDIRNLAVYNRLILINDVLLLKSYKSEIKYTDTYYPIFMYYKQIIFNAGDIEVFIKIEKDNIELKEWKDSNPSFLTLLLKELYPNAFIS